VNKNEMRDFLWRLPTTWHLSCSHFVTFSGVLGLILEDLFIFGRRKTGKAAF